MGTYKENVEFTLGKIDSLFTMAMPHLKDGAEAAVKYAVADAWIGAVGAAIGIGVLIGAPILAFRLGHKYIENSDTKSAPGFVTLLLCGLLLAVGTPYLWGNVSCAVKASVSPGVYTVLKLAGKDCQD